MTYVFAIRIVTSFLLASWVVPAAAKGPKPVPVDQAFHFTVELGEEEGLELIWSIEPGYYLYRDKMVATLDGKPLKLRTRQGDVKDDPTFGSTEVYHQATTASVEAVPETGEVLVTYQGCGENTICYPPVTKAIDLATLLVSDSGERTDRAGASSGPEIAVPSTLTVRNGASADAPDLEAGYVSTFLTFLGLGVLLAFTPCVFPMLPILSGILTRSNKPLSLRRSFSLSASYVLAMASAYGVIGIFAAWSGDNLQADLQTPTALGVMSAVFLALALSMFGLYELQLPQSWRAKLTSGAGRAGSIGGAALLGFSSALIVGPCVTPPLAAALIYVAQTGNALRGSSALFALGLGTGLPLLLFGTFGTAVLPKSGPWLIRIKQGFGFLFIGLAIWMASRVLPLPLIAASWGFLLIGIAGWVGLPFLRQSAPDWNWQSVTRVSIAFFVAIYGGFLTVGVVNGWYEPLRPFVSAGIVPSIIALGPEQGRFQIVTNESDLDAAIASGRKAGRVVLIDFSADWCTECRVMERTVFADANVRQRLNGVKLIRADMTRYDVTSRELMKRFAVIGPPTLIFLSPAGAEVEGTRTVGKTEVNDLLSKIAAAQHS
jgi:thioredoxin:protein disulfide reductase